MRGGFGRKWRAGSALRRAWEILRADGIRSLWFKLLGETVYRRVFLFEHPSDAPAVPVGPEAPVIGLLQAGEIGDYLAFEPAADAAAIGARLRNGQLCFIARHQGRIAAAAWLAGGTVRLQYLDCDLRLAPNEVYYYGLYTDPALRGRRLAGALAAAMGQWSREHGHSRLLAAVMPENRAVLQVLARAGCRRCGKIAAVKIFRYRRVFSRGPGAPLAGLPQ